MGSFGAPKKCHVISNLPWNLPVPGPFAGVARGFVWLAARKPSKDLHESERNFRLLVEGITDYAIYMLDPEGRVTNWNKGAERIKGYKAREIVGKHFSVFYTPEDRAARSSAAGIGNSPKGKAFPR